MMTYRELAIVLIISFWSCLFLFLGNPTMSYNAVHGIQLCSQIVGGILAIAGVAYCQHLFHKLIFPEKYLKDDLGLISPTDPD